MKSVLLQRRQVQRRQEEAVERALVARPAWRAKCHVVDLVAFRGSRGVKGILVGVDGSRESHIAAKYAADLARATGARLILACAVFAPDPLGDPELVARTSVWEEEEHERGEGQVGQVAAAVARRGLACETRVVGGPAISTLADLARGCDVDLVVVGHRKRSALSRMFIGSVADRLVEICPKPVLVVR